MHVHMDADAPAPTLGHEHPVGLPREAKLKDHDGRAQRGHPLAQRSSAAPSAMKKPAASPA